MFLHSFVIICMKKNAILTLKNEILKHTEFASEWRKSLFRGLKISKFSGGGCPRTPLLGRRLRRTPFIEPSHQKNWIRASLLSRDIQLANGELSVAC